MVSVRRLRSATVSSSVSSRCMAMPGNRVLSKLALLIVPTDNPASNMSDLDPDRLTLRQADAAREDYAQLMEELDFVKAQLARLPTRRDLAFKPLRMIVTTALTTAAIVILWFEAFWRHCP
jgi:hypothetical protein